MEIIVYHDNPSGKDAFLRPGDYWHYDESSLAFSVADSPFRYLTAITRKYPQDDHGQEASKIFCESTVKYLTNSTDIGQALMKSNEDIKKYNEKIGRVYGDPVQYDQAETVGITVKIMNNVLYWGGVEDCYVNVLDSKTLENKTQINFSMVKSSKYIKRLKEKGELEKHIDDKLKKKIPEKYWWEPYWCNYLRNNPDAIDENNNPIGWGCFNGETEVTNFIQKGEVKLNKGDHILIFSDGIIPYLENEEIKNYLLANPSTKVSFDKELRELVMKYFRDTREEEREGTLIYFKWEG